MRVTEKLFLENNRKKNKKKNGEEWEETMTYATRNKKINLNQAKDHARESSLFRGINTDKSSFDRLATFHTSKK